MSKRAIVWGMFFSTLLWVIICNIAYQLVADPKIGDILVLSLSIIGFGAMITLAFLVRMK